MVTLSSTTSNWKIVIFNQHRDKQKKTKTEVHHVHLWTFCSGVKFSLKTTQKKTKTQKIYQNVIFFFKWNANFLKVLYKFTRKFCGVKRARCGREDVNSRRKVGATSDLAFPTVGAVLRCDLWLLFHAFRKYKLGAREKASANPAVAFTETHRGCFG